MARRQERFGLAQPIYVCSRITHIVTFFCVDICTMAAHAPGGAVRKVTRVALMIVTAQLLATAVRAHEGHEDVPSLVESIEISQIVTGLALLISLALYITGTARLWRAAGRGHGISLSAAAAFSAGWLSLVISLIGPFHELSESLFSAHMTQHEILMLISAPLIVLGRPQIAAMWALPRARRSIVASVTNAHQFVVVWRFISGSFVAFLIHAAALWIWHIPALFDATLESDWIHALQHASFFGTALLFWWAIVNSRIDWKSSFVGVLFLFLTSLHSGILGAFLTFTHQIWYPVYLNSTGEYGLTPLEDQQLGGLIMWVPAGLVYIGAGLTMFARLLSESEKRAVRNEQLMFSQIGATNL
jgi:putative membrane protein